MSYSLLSGGVLGNGTKHVKGSRSKTQREGKRLSGFQFEATVKLPTELQRRESMTTDELRCWRRECGHGQ